MTDLLDLSNKRILIVDDMPEMIETTSQMLRHHGAARLFRAADAEAALAILRAEKGVDCVISDFNMSPVSGLHFLGAVRTGLHAEVPRDQRFVLLTGHGEKDVVIAAQALDVSGYVVKPVSLKTLIQSLQRAFSRPLQLKPVSAYLAVPPVRVPT